MNDTTNRIGWLAAFVLVLLCCGCFQAENPFYRDFVGDGIQTSGVLHGNPLYEVLQRHRNLKYRTSYQGAPVDPHIRVITNPTAELQALLLEEGGNEKVFGFSGERLVKRKE